MLADPKPEHQNLEEFLEYIYDNEEGYCYIALKTPPDKEPANWKQHFFKWPEEKKSVVDKILTERSSWEVYFGISLYSEPSGKREAVKGARVVWVEHDGEIPTYPEGIPEPTLKIHSGGEGHEHHYWKSSKLLDGKTLDRINRALTYISGADSSGWDCTQVLRPPATINHKRNREVTIVSQTQSVYDPTLFKGLPDPPPLLEEPLPETLPAVEDVVSKYQFPVQVWDLFKKGMPEGKRSDGLMSLGYSLAELQLTNDEILAMLLNADMRWGKFAHRTDQVRRLMEIVTISRAKYPLQSGPVEKKIEHQSIGLLSLLKSEVKLEWVWQDYLQKSGYMLVTGPSGVGKTQFSLDAAAHFALGQDFLDTHVESPLKIGFFSLEMGLVDLKEFLLTQSQGYTDEELNLLEKNLRFFPIGEPIYLNRDEEKRRIEAVVESEGLDGIIVDSLGSTTEGELTSEKDIKNLLDWNDHIRQEWDVFTWYIHHHRKATGDNKRPNKLSDVYGSQYITARATTVLCLWDAGVINSLQAIILKLRLAKKPEPFNLYRDGKLHFTKKKAGITIVEPTKPSPDEQEKVAKLDPTENTPNAGKGFSI